ncbi:MAG: cysteine synthase family protein [candidate division Zixibacteria bacterium]|nr:cysteine synthase family protein [candidate division Zixibacteria bacterium]
MTPEIERKVQSLSFLVGNTPLLEVEFKLGGRIRKIYAKAEHLNMTGSIKDRMALHILKRAYHEGRLRPGDTIVEATSGNTGISFAAIGRALGHPVTIFMPNWMSRERVDLIQSLGADIKGVSREEGGFVGSISMAEEMSRTCDNCFLPSQFSNIDNVDAHYEATAPELWWQLQYNGHTPDAFVAGVGTGGTIMGVGKYFREHQPLTKIHPMEPANSPTLRTGKKIGQHRIQGISDEFIPSIINFDSLDSIIDVDDGDAIIMAQKLAGRLGLAVGISSGANFLAAIKVQDQIHESAVVATVFPDDNKKYLSTDLLKEEPVKTDFVSTEVELLGYSAFKRVCHTCCDFEHCTERKAQIEHS